MRSHPPQDSAEAAVQPLAGVDATGRLRAARRIVVKIGSALLVDDRTGKTHRTWLDALTDEVALLRRRGQEVILVSSGAVAVGRRILGLTDPHHILRLEEKQAAAATGQIRLAHAWQEALAHHDITVAQVLMTLDDSENRRRYLNARKTFEQLLSLGAVPVVNENDTVTTQEIRFGDNDRLAARVAAMVSADALVLLSDIDGLYTANPRVDPTARRLDEVRAMTPEIEAMAGAAGSSMGTGGMVTKLIAARIAMDAGCAMAIAPGKGLGPLGALEAGGPCTWFVPAQEPRAARKRWIAGALKPEGALVLDAGAVRALMDGKSLLPAGVTRVDGRFQKGAAVRILDPKGRRLGVGLTNYPADEAAKLAGHRTGDIEDVLGYRGPDELVHRDDLALT
ncbi:glutamate 5-kinase [Roseospira marina]|uniref:Glutamate 5-kinase n=1 Tax=Roseospira marina TaxID=140057 RepID=A0A5M6I9P1_9PROT|nr:glutamate 5-kinase [Roseospira marina]KAA5604677.1 glutamate 5-kinase [Roseospira marina]MBB4315123.1 glutamate 5-kinase [Roseospira marina]MBB5088107.1 glutamate 5-kinase [Roseospira marina]